MNRHEAKALLVAQLAVFRQRPFADLVRLVDEPEVATEVAPSGHSYQLELVTEALGSQAFRRCVS